MKKRDDDIGRIARMHSHHNAAAAGAGSGTSRRMTHYHNVNDNRSVWRYNRYSVSCSLVSVMQHQQQYQLSKRGYQPRKPIGAAKFLKADEVYSKHKPKLVKTSKAPKGRLTGRSLVIPCTLVAISLGIIVSGVIFNPDDDDD